MSTATKTANITELHQDKKNANRGTKRGAKMVADSLKNYGAGRSILLDRNNNIIAGNKTTAGATAAGIQKVRIIETDGTELVAVKRTDLDIDDPKARELAIVDNRAGEISLNWDADALAQLANDGADITKFWGEDDVDRIIGATPGNGSGRTGAGADIDETEAAKLQAKWQTAKGQTWEIPSLNTPGSAHRIRCGSSTDVADVAELFGPRRAALVNTDPPYGVSYKSAKTGAIANDAKQKDALARLLMDALRLAIANSAQDAAFYIWHATSTRRDFEHALDRVGLEEKQYITWAKDSFVLGHADYHWQSEPCFYAQKAGESAAFHGDRAQSTIWRLTRGTPTDDRGASYAIGTGLVFLDGAGGELAVTAAAPKGKKQRTIRLNTEAVLLTSDAGNSDLWSVTRDKKGGMLHPNQKPTELAARAIRNSSQPSDWIYDPFGGSGFTMLGAEQEGRVALTMELDPKFVAVQLERMAQAGLQPRQAKG